MSEYKFTEEQYQKIVEMFEKVNDEYNMGFLNPTFVSFFQKELDNFFGDLLYSIDGWDKVSAIANPITREWAHEQFVEEEKKYVWTSKKKDKSNYSMVLWRDGDGMVRTCFKNKYIMLRKSWYQLTESEIREWGYNPDMFDKEEVN